MLDLPKMKFSATTINKFSEFACIQVHADKNVEKQPVHLCVVLDTSTSMDMENKLENVRQSMKFMLDFLGPKDMLSIISFSQTARNVLNKVYVTAEEKENIRTRISLIRSETNTNLSAGIIVAQDSLVNIEGYKQGILILTDGHTNVGITQPNDIVKMSSNLGKLFPGTSISTIGYGTDHNTELLQNISSEGGGTYYVVKDMEDVAHVFGDILGGLLSCVAQQVTVSLPEGVEVKTRYAVHNSPGSVDVVIGDMPAGMEAAIIAKISEGTTVSLKGYDLQDNSSFTTTGLVEKNDDLKTQAECEAHYLRFIVTELIEKARKAIMYKETDVTEIMNDIQKYSVLIVEYKEKNTNELWNILLEELKDCNETLERYRVRGGNDYETQASAQVMAQRTTYLGRMKGIAAKGLTPKMGEGLGELSRGFSNLAQRQISTQIQSQVSPSQGDGSQGDGSQLPMPMSIGSLKRQIAVPHTD